MDTTTIATVAKITSISASFGLAGYSFCCSQNFLGGILKYNPPAGISTQLFSHVFHEGGAVVLPASLLAATGAGYLAYTKPDQRAFWTTNAVCVLLPLPWTRLYMFPGIQRLLEISRSAIEQEKVTQSGEHIGLLKAWVWQNYMRAASHFVGGMAALLATVGS